MDKQTENSYLIVIAGAKASGKTLLMHLLQEKLSKNLKPLEKFSTRPRRLDDINLISTTALPDLVDLRYFSFGNEYGISSDHIDKSLLFGESRVVNISDIEILRKIKKKYSKNAVIIYVDGEDYQKALRIVQSRYYAEHGAYIPEDFFKNQSELYEQNRDLFDYTIVNNKTPEWMFEQVETFIQSKLYNQETVWQNNELLIPEIKEKITLDLVIANDRINRYFAKNPNEIFKLTSREFENLIAGILYDLKYDVELTKSTRDGGFDIKAIKKDGLGPLLYLVECKKYAPDRPVGIEVIRQLHSVKTSLQASKAVLVTTSYFTKDAKDLQRNLGYQLDLKDFNDIKEWLNPYKK